MCLQHRHLQFDHGLRGVPILELAIVSTPLHKHSSVGSNAPPRWGVWRQNCESVYMKKWVSRHVYPLAKISRVLRHAYDVPSGTAVPFWAYLNYTVWEYVPVCTTCPLTERHRKRVVSIYLLQRRPGETQKRPPVTHQAFPSPLQQHTRPTAPHPR